MFYLLVIFPFYQFVINTLEYRFDIFCVLFQFCFCLTALNLRNFLLQIHLIIHQSFGTHSPKIIVTQNLCYCHTPVWEADKGSP